MQFLIILFIAFIAFVNAFYKTVPEGHVGVFLRKGVFDPKIVTGSNWYWPGFPYWQDVVSVKYIQDHDEVAKLKCVSKEGVDVYIDSIQIANRIDPTYVLQTTKLYGTSEYDKVLVVNPLAQKMRELCAERTVDEIEITDFHLLDDLLKVEIQEQNTRLKTGITIDWVRVTGITVPVEIKAKRLQLAAEKANKILTEETMKRTKLEKEQQQFISQKDSDIKLQVSANNNREMLLNTQAEFEKKVIENRMLIDGAKANAEKIMLEAKALEAMYGIPGYADVEKSRHLSGNTKIYYGDKLPNVIYSTGSVFNQQVSE